ncbi:unnamed protein product [Pedinophyceae sp. YPF-701]|nr:unnamed protein product [Pedinophyceae sp. YPF-701]
MGDPMEIYGTHKATFNMEKVLFQNVLSSLYYQELVKRGLDYESLVYEVYDAVTDCEPWMSGNARGPSTCFCIMVRLFELEVSEKDIQAMLDTTDCPYVRAIGFLFIRFGADPRKFPDWFYPYLEDPEKFKPSPFGEEVTIGEFVRDILLKMEYFETLFPRCPEGIRRKIMEKCRELGLPDQPKGNGGTGGGDRRGHESGSRPASVKASLSVAFGQRAPNRRGNRENAVARAGDARRGGPGPTSGGPDRAAGWGGDGEAPRAQRGRSPDGRGAQRGYGQRTYERGGYEQDRERDRGFQRGGDRDGYDRGRDRGYDRSRDYRGGERDVEHRGHSRDRDRGGYSRDRRDSRDRGDYRGYNRDGYHGRDAGHERGRDRGREWDRRDGPRRSPARYEGRRRSRSRSPRRGGSAGGRSAADVFGRPPAELLGAGAAGASSAALGKYGDAGRSTSLQPGRLGSGNVAASNTESFRIGGGRR